MVCEYKGLFTSGHRTHTKISRLTFTNLRRVCEVRNEDFVSRVRTDDDTLSDRHRHAADRRIATLAEGNRGRKGTHRDEGLLDVLTERVVKRLERRARDVGVIVPDDRVLFLLLWVSRVLT